MTTTPNQRMRARKRYPRGTWRPGAATNDPPDPVAVERLLRGERGFWVSRADRAAALQKADPPDGEGGWKRLARDVALQLGTTMRTVQRHRAHRLAAELEERKIKDLAEGRP